VRRPAATFFYTARGDALLDLGISDGSILVVDRGMTLRAGSIVVADRDRQRCVCRLPGTGEVGGELTVWGLVTAIVTRVRP
jgi:DNA polymerase V